MHDLSFLQYLYQVDHSFKDQAISERTLWKNLLSSGRWTLDVPSCHLEHAEFQEEAKLFGWSRFISTFTFKTFLNDSGPFWPVAVICGCPWRFPALLGWKRHLKGQKFWTVLSLQFHGTSYFERSKPANLEACRSELPLCSLAEAESRICQKHFLNSFKFGVVS